MEKYSNVINLIKNQAEKNSVSANDLLNLLIRTIEETEKINGEEVSKSKVDDTSRFADDIWYLSGQLLDTINNNTDALDELPVALKTQFNEDYQQLSENNEKLKGTHEQLVETRGQKEMLTESISSLKAQINDLDSISKEVKALDELKGKLSSELEEKSNRLSDYKNTITVIKNAMGSLSSKPDIVELIESSTGVSFEKLKMNSFVDLQKWFDMMESSLKQGIEIYTRAYSIILEIVENTTHKINDKEN